MCVCVSEREISEDKVRECVFAIKKALCRDSEQLRLEEEIIIYLRSYKMLALR